MPLSVSPFTHSQSALFLVSNVPLYLWPRPLKNVWFYVSSVSNSAIFNFECVPGQAGIPGNKHADSFPKAGASLATAVVPCSSSSAIAKTRYIQYHKWRSHISTFLLPSQLSHSYSSLLELVLSHPISFELSAFASKVKASYNCR